MIYDKIENAATYAGLSEGIREGLEYLAKMTPDTPVGVYEISPRARAIVTVTDALVEKPPGTSPVQPTNRLPCPGVAVTVTTVLEA